jgi:outer membrane protein OmpA-like peptidoglycan-associated protein
MRRLSIANPCEASWEEMTGTARSRRCAACAKEVHDLSAMREVEARALLMLLGSRGLCVRFTCGEEGQIHHAPEPSAWAPALTPLAAGIVAAGIVAAAAGCGPQALTGSPGAAAALAPIHEDVTHQALASAPPPPPADVDTDHDGILDRDDACPNEPGGAAAEPQRNGCHIFVGLTVTQGDIQSLQSLRFAYGVRRIEPSGQPLLEELARLLNERPELKRIAIRGHASADEPNPDKLSAARAKAVIDALTQKGVDASRLVAEPHGKAEPIADNATKAGREKNRRVDFKLLDQPERSPSPSDAHSSMH